MARSNVRRKVDIWAEDAKWWIERQAPKRKGIKAKIGNAKLALDPYLDPFLMYAAATGLYTQQAMEIYNNHANNPYKAAAIGTLAVAGAIAGARLLAYPATFLHRRAKNNEHADAASWAKTIFLTAVACYTLQDAYAQAKRQNIDTKEEQSEQAQGLVEKVLSHKWKSTTYSAILEEKIGEDTTAKANIATIIALEVGNERDWERAASPTGPVGPGQFTRGTAAEVGLCDDGTPPCERYDHRTNPEKVIPAIGDNIQKERDRILSCTKRGQRLDDKTLDILAIGAHNGGSAIICSALKAVGEEPTTKEIRGKITPGRVKAIYSRDSLRAIERGYKSRSRSERRSGADIKAAEIRNYMQRAEQLRWEFQDALE